MTRIDGSNRDVWITSLARNGDTRFTFDPARDDFPIWSPDGNRIAFSSDRAGPFNLYQHASNGAGQDELLLKSDHNKFATDWSHDGKWLLYYDVDPKTRTDLWVLPIDGPSKDGAAERKPVPFLRTEFTELDGRFSPDGRWIAYVSDESGRYEVYVRPFPVPAGGGGKWMVSQGAGAFTPHWRADGKELFYLTADGTLMAAEVSASGAAFHADPPKALFKGPINVVGFDLSADGKKFLLPMNGQESAQAPFNIIQNWTSLLKK